MEYKCCNFKGVLFLFFCGNNREIKNQNEEASCINMERKENFNLKKFRGPHTLNEKKYYFKPTPSKHKQPSSNQHPCTNHN